MKVCSKCCQDKPLDEFPPDKTAKSGLRSSCRACSYSCHAKWLANNKGKMRQLQADWRKRNPEYHKEHAKSHRKERAESAQRHRKKYPEKVYARNQNRKLKIYAADECQHCQSYAHLEGHHPDYAKPLEVMWLCKKCHIKQHQKETK